MNEKINEFLFVLSKEVNSEITFVIRKKLIEVNYENIKIIIGKTDDLKEEDVTYIEDDYINALCRLRLLVIERLNRMLPNESRHPFYRDLDIYFNKPLPSFFKTDHLKNIYISY